MASENWARWVEILTRLVIAVTSLLPILLKLIRGQEDAPTVKDLLANVGESSSKPARSLSELAVALSYSALLSLLWAYFIGISGQLLSWSRLILVGLIVTVLLTAILVFAWLRNQLDWVLVGIAALSILVIVFTGGGIFFASGQGEDSIQVSLPLLVLLIIVSAFWFQISPRSIFRLSPRLAKKLRSFALVGLCLLVALSMGVEFTRNLYEGKDVLRVAHKEARNLLLKLNNEPIASRRLFYQLASEIALSSFYQEQFLAGPSLRNQKESSQRFEEQETIDEVGSEGLDVGLNAVREPRQADPGESKKPGQCPDPQLLKIFSEGIEGFAPEIYMANRLKWIHPLGDGKKAKAEIPLPGTTAEDRLRTTSRWRIFESLEGQEAAKKRLLDSCEYPGAWRDLLNGVESQGIGFDFSAAPTHVDSLLPEFDPYSGNSILKFQMGLPAPSEALVAFSQYRALASHFAGSPRLEGLVKNFGLLAPEIQNAYNHYLGSPSDRLRNYRLLHYLSDIPIDFDTNFDALTAVASLEKALPDRRAPASAPVAALQQQEGTPVVEVKTELVEAPANDDVLALGAAISARLASVGDRIIRDELLGDLKSLLKQNNPAVPVVHLFRRKSLDFAREVNSQLSDDDAGKLLEICSSPVVPAVRQMVQRPPLLAQTEGGSTGTLLEAFAGLPNDEDREAVLYHVASQFYRADSLWQQLEMAVSSASLHALNVDIVVATVLSMPVVIFVVLLGVYFSRILSARDMLRRSIHQESARTQSPVPNFAISANIVGREQVLAQLMSLARRGWGTIALVGQRGVGKTRILQEILSTGGRDGEKPCVGVWITAPARFEENEFISSTLEQIATQVERTVAHYLGAEPLAARELEEYLKFGWFAHIILIWAAFFLFVVQISSKLSEPTFVIALAPTFLMLLAAGGIGHIYWSSLQPADLTYWLQERQSKHAQAVLMYQEASDVLQSFSSRPSLVSSSRLFQKIMIWVLGFFAVYFLAGFLALTLVTAPVRRNSWSWVVMLVVVFLSMWAVVRRRQKVISSDKGLMSLVRRYRDYVAGVVARLKMGALGDISARRVGVVVCIDELDKIVDLGEVREFVRRIKGMFEVPGVYYYLSIAEDAFNSLYLGSVDGKNEIDSSFDHIVRIMPLAAGEIEILVQGQLNRLGVTDADERVVQAVAAVSFGSPRDALRLCDELVAYQEDDPKRKILGVIKARRITEARSSYELRHIGREVYDTLSGDPGLCREWVRNLVLHGDSSEKPRPEEERVMRIAVACWLLSLIELSLGTVNGSLWISTVERICEIGSQISITGIQDITPKIIELDDWMAKGFGAEIK